MNERLKALAEIAGIELAYARAEVEMAERIGEGKERIASHLDAVSDALELIASGIEEFEMRERLVEFAAESGLSGVMVKVWTKAFWKS